MFVGFVNSIVNRGDLKDHTTMHCFSLSRKLQQAVLKLAVN